MPDKDLFYIYECFVCVYVCAPCACVVSSEVRDGVKFLGTAVLMDRSPMWMTWSSLRVE